MSCETVFATAATADRANAEIGIIWWLTSVEGYALAVADYDLFDVASVNADWVETFFRRSAELVAEHDPATRGCFLRVEHHGLIDLFTRADGAYRETRSGERLDRSAFDIREVEEYEAKKWPATFDERAYAVRPLVDSKKVIRPATGLRRFAWNSIYSNHLAAQVRGHRPGDAPCELVGAFVLGVLLGTTPRSMSFFAAMNRRDAPEAKSAPSQFAGAYLPGRRPL